MKLQSIALALLLGATSYVHATSVAFVNTQKIVQEAPQAEAVRNQLEKEFSKRGEQLNKEKDAIEAMQKRASRDAAVMSATEQRKLERELEAKIRDFKASQEAFAEDVNIRRQEELAKMQRSMAQVVIEVAKKNNFDIVLESGVVYAAPASDMTDAVIEELKKRR